MKRVFIRFGSYKTREVLIPIFPDLNLYLRINNLAYSIFSSQDHSEDLLASSERPSPPGLSIIREDRIF